MEKSTFLNEDHLFVWHPYQNFLTSELLQVVKAKGSYLYTADHKAYLDGNSSWWINLHGHCHPYILDRIQNTMHSLDQISFGDCTHPMAVELAKRLLVHFPNYSKVFYSDNGSTAVEIALKMALQYWDNHKNPQRKKVICFEGSFHGETFGAMSAAGRNHFNRPFWSHLFEITKIPVPQTGEQEFNLSEIEKIIKSTDSACFIFEPLIQGANGMKTYSKLGLEKILKLCKENHVLTIADEVMTGFGRTGPLFVSQQLSTKPNIICLAKGLSGGTLPLAATICDQEIVHAFFGLKQQHFFFHGHTYTANPIACSAAIASLDLLEDIQCNVKRNEITKKHTEFKKKIESCQGVSRIEAFGTILAIECQIKKNHDYFDPIRKKLYRFFLDQHILMRPLGNVIYFIPPYSIQEHELEKIYFTTQLFLENPC